MADYYVCKDPNTVLTTIIITVGKMIQSKSSTFDISVRMIML